MTMYEAWGKRVLDIGLSLLGLLLLSPVLLALSCVGAAVLGGNPFFVQTRPGKDEKLFRLVKFRSMTNARGPEGDLLPDEKRLTGYGLFLRATSLDELPELWNVLRGDMSLVGPRPQLVRDLVFMTAEQKNRHRVRPGITGLAQISGRNGISWEEKLQLDLEYLEKITFLKDISILWKTVWTVLFRQGISQPGWDTALDLGDWLLANGRISRAAYESKQRLARKLLRKDDI